MMKSKWAHTPKDEIIEARHPCDGTTMEPTHLMIKSPNTNLMTKNMVAQPPRWWSQGGSHRLVNKLLRDSMMQSQYATLMTKGTACPARPNDGITMGTTQLKLKNIMDPYDAQIRHRTRHGHGRNIDFTQKSEESDTIRHDTLSILKYPSRPSSPFSCVCDATRSGLHIKHLVNISTNYSFSHDTCKPLFEVFQLQFTPWWKLLRKF